jgi:uncharacterized protein YuzE
LFIARTAPYLRGNCPLGQRSVAAAIGTKFDPESDGLHVAFDPGNARYDHAQEVVPGVFVEADAAGNSIGIDVIPGSRPVESAHTLAAESPSAGAGPMAEARFLRPSTGPRGTARGPNHRCKPARAEDRWPRPPVHPISTPTHGPGRGRFLPMTFRPSLTI